MNNYEKFSDVAERFRIIAAKLSPSDVEFLYEIFRKQDCKVIRRKERGVSQTPYLYLRQNARRNPKRTAVYIGRGVTQNGVVVPHNSLEYFIKAWGSLRSSAYPANSILLKNTIIVGESPLLREAAEISILRNIVREMPQAGGLILDATPEHFTVLADEGVTVPSRVIPYGPRPLTVNEFVDQTGAKWLLADTAGNYSYYTAQYHDDGTLVRKYKEMPVAERQINIPFVHWRYDLGVGYRFSVSPELTRPSPLKLTFVRSHVYRGVFATAPIFWDPHYPQPGLEATFLTISRLACPGGDLPPQNEISVISRSLTSLAMNAPTVYSFFNQALEALKPTSSATQKALQVFLDNLSPTEVEWLSQKPGDPRCVLSGSILYCPTSSLSPKERALCHISGAVIRQLIIRENGNGSVRLGRVPTFVVSSLDEGIMPGVEIERMRLAEGAQLYNIIRLSAMSKLPVAQGHLSPEKLSNLLAACGVKIFGKTEDVASDAYVRKQALNLENLQKANLRERAVAARTKYDIVPKLASISDREAVMFYPFSANSGSSTGVLNLEQDPVYSLEGAANTVAALNCAYRNWAEQVVPLE